MCVCVPNTGNVMTERILLHSKEGAMAFHRDRRATPLCDKIRPRPGVVVTIMTVAGTEYTP